MDQFLPFWILCLSPFLVFFTRGKYKYISALGIGLIIVGLTSYWSGRVLMTGHAINGKFPFAFLSGDMHIVIDQLSAFFILIVNFTVLTGLLYAKGYLRSYSASKNKHQFSLHYFNYLWLYLSMLLVAMVRDGLSFLIVWELMSLSSFMLVIFEAEKEDILKTGLNYLIQMHIGFMFLLVGFVLTGEITGTMSFNVLADAFGSDRLTELLGNHGNFWLFLIFFIGFGTKAGFIPLHTWLPHAHPAAPSHVSGVMSGVMIKMGIYGILRVLTAIQDDWLIIGSFLLGISILTGLYGVMMAIVQHDLKKLLAYHSIENIGIIGIGISLGIIGIASDNPTLAILGFSGGLLHILNHSLFKSLLFYGAGSVYKATHTRDLNSLGGLVKSMPKTAGLFLLGAMAISGLPPFNGFVSEFLIYSGLFDSLNGAGMNFSLVFLSAIVGLALIGGLAIFCFTKAFGIVFLGTSRTPMAAAAEEVETSMLFPKYLIGFMILAIGLLPFVFLEPVQEVVKLYLPVTNAHYGSAFSTLSQLSIAAAILIGVSVLLFFLRSRQQQKVEVAHGPTWGCGYSAADPAIHQYTATSFADNYKQLAKPIVGSITHYRPLEEEEIFPQTRSFESHASDKIEKNMILRSSRWLMKIMERAAVLQTGKIQHYLIYPLVFMAVIFLLTLLNLI